MPRIFNAQADERRVIREIARFDKLQKKAARHGIELRESPLVGFVSVSHGQVFATGHLSTLARHVHRVLEQRAQASQKAEAREICLD